MDKLSIILGKIFFDTSDGQKEYNIILHLKDKLLFFSSPKGSIYKCVPLDDLIPNIRVFNAKLAEFKR